VTPEKLRMIEEAEAILKDLGFCDLRVRHHELPGGVGQPGDGVSPSALARIELATGEIPRFLEDGMTARAGEALQKLGYAHVTLDLAGYRRGSLNTALTRDQAMETNTAR